MIFSGNGTLTRLWGEGEVEFAEGGYGMVGEFGFLEPGVAGSVFAIDVAKLWAVGEHLSCE